MYACVYHTHIYLFYLHKQVDVCADLLQGLGDFSIHSVELDMVGITVLPTFGT